MTEQATRDVKTSLTWALDTGDKELQQSAVQEHAAAAKDFWRQGQEDAEQRRAKVPQKFRRKALEFLVALNWTIMIVCGWGLERYLLTPEQLAGDPTQWASAFRLCRSGI